MSTGHALRPSASSVRALAGRYRLTLLAADSLAPRAVAEGTLVLAPTDSAHRRFIVLGHETRSAFVLVGSTAADLTPLASLVVSPASGDVNAPGVQVNAGGTMVVGNPTSSEGQAFDAGVTFFIRKVGDSGFAGTWQGGTPTVPLPHGGFCAQRITGAVARE